MLRLPAQLRIGPYALHLDVLAARMRRRPIRRVGWWALFLLVFVGGMGIGLPFVRGTGVIVVPDHDPQITLSLNSRELKSNSVRVPAGRHIFHVERAGTFPVDQTVDVTKAHTTTLTLPLLRPIPRVQRLPLPGSGSTWTQVEPEVSGGWRLSATQPESEGAVRVQPGWGTASDARPPRTLLHLDAGGITPLPVLEANDAADEIVTQAGERFWALWEPQKTASRPGIVGTLSLATPKGTQTLSTTAALEGLWWSPGGHMLLLALTREQGVDLALLDPGHPQTESFQPIITVSGAIQSVNWNPDGRAVVVTSAAPETTEPVRVSSRPTQTSEDTVPAEGGHTPRSAVLLQLPSDSKTPRAIRLHSPPAYWAGIVSLDWFAGDLWWVADTGLGLALERVSLSSDTLQRVAELPSDVAAFRVLPDKTVRIVRATPDKQLVVERWPEATQLFTLPDIVTSKTTGGIWRDSELVLATSDTELWYIQIQPEALQ